MNNDFGLGSKIVFLGPLFNENDYDYLTSIVKGAFPSVAPNVFQNALINGIEKNLNENIRIINALPIGTYPNHSNQLILKKRLWSNGDKKCVELNTINLPFFKQISRENELVKELSKEEYRGCEVILYSTYMPFLKALKRVKNGLKITLIVTDLPEYYELANEGFIKSNLRKLQNKQIYESLSCVDRYVLLTKHMLNRLPVGKKPYMILEGIYNVASNEQYIVRNEKKMIFYAGTLRYIYGIKNLLDAFELIDNTNIELHIAGSGEAEEEIKQLSLKDSRVVFHGFTSHDEVAKLNKQASILVNPRPNEGEYTKYSFPSKTMEYLASGTPVVMYRLDGIPNEYDQYLNYVNENTVLSLKQQLETVLENYPEAEKKASLAKQFIYEKKSSVAQAKRLINFIEEN